MFSRVKDLVGLSLGVALFDTKLFIFVKAINDSFVISEILFVIEEIDSVKMFYIEKRESFMAKNCYVWVIREESM
jgi:hypothetical protein